MAYRRDDGVILQKFSNSASSLSQLRAHTRAVKKIERHIVKATKTSFIPLGYSGVLLSILAGLKSRLGRLFSDSVRCGSVLLFETRRLSRRGGRRWLIPWSLRRLCASSTWVRALLELLRHCPLRSLDLRE